MNQQKDQSPTIGATIRLAFRLADDAKKLRDAIAKLLPTTVTPRDHAVLHRAYAVLGDFVGGFNQLEDRIVEMRAINKYLT